MKPSQVVFYIFVIAVVALALHFILPQLGIFALWISATVVVFLVALFFGK